MNEMKLINLFKKFTAIHKYAHVHQLQEKRQLDNCKRHEGKALTDPLKTQHNV